MGDSVRRFVHDQRSVRVVFSPGALNEIAAEVDRLALKRVVLISSKRYVSRVEALLGDRVAAVVDQPVMHVPVDEADKVTTTAEESGADGAVAVGGGSAVGLAKALALRTRVPVLAAPTTFSGSEMTRVWGLTEGGVKRTGRDDVVAPRTVIYDPDLLATLPVATAVASAFNAIAHAVEALYAPDRTPVTDLLAAEAVRAIATAVPGIVARQPDATAEALYGAWLSGSCLDSTTMALHHKLCHALGGTLGLPHAETHTVVLPHALAYNSGSSPTAVAALRRTLGADDPATFLYQLASLHGAPTALQDLGMTAEDVDRLATVVMAAPYANPRPVTEDDVRALLRRALIGALPASNPASDGRG